MANHRRTVAAAVATILASVSLYPIFQGSAWFFTGAGTVIVVALTGTLTRLRRLPVAVVLPCYVVVLLLWLNLLFASAKSLGHVLPTFASIATLFDSAGQGFNEASAYAPPVPELRGMLLLAAAGIGIAAVGTDLIAVRLSNAALAGLPLLLLFTEPFTLSVSRGWIGTSLAFCCGVAGYLALLSSETRDKIREWGDPDPLYVADPATLAAAGRRLSFTSIVIALCVPLFIPGLHASRLFGGHPGIGGYASTGIGGSGGVGGVGLSSPNMQLTSELQDSATAPELSYVSNDPNGPNYLQVYTFNVLTNSGWQLGTPQLAPAGRSLPPTPGLSESAAGPVVTTDITLASPAGSYADNSLPVPYPAAAVKASGNLTADKSSLSVYDNGVSFNGLSYTVTSHDPTPSYQQLAAAAAPPASITSSYESVPASYDSLKPLAQQETAGATTELAKAVALQNWFSGGAFKYSLKAPSVTNAAELTQFLRAKTGYCEQFSFAMATFARLVGIPARIVWGYTAGAPANQQGPQAGSLVGSDVYLVNNHDAHAWPELYFQGYGWLRFEPTPAGVGGQGTAFAPIYTDKSLSGPGTTQTQPTQPTTAPTTGIVGNPHLNQPQPQTGTVKSAKSAWIDPWVIVGLVLAFLIVAGAVAPWCARRVVRQRRWQGKGKGLAQDRVRARDIAWAHAAWEELRDDLSDHGAPSLPSESPRAVAARASTGLGLAEPARAALGRIAMAEERARYAPTPSDGSGLHADSATVRRAIAAAVPRETRWRARAFPASVVTPALRALGSMADLYRGLRRG